MAFGVLWFSRVKFDKVLGGMVLVFSNISSAWSDKHKNGSVIHFI